MPEDWPLTPFALFAWSGQQWEVPLLYHYYPLSATTTPLVPHYSQDRTRATVQALSHSVTLTDHTAYGYGLHCIL